MQRRRLLSRAAADRLEGFSSVVEVYALVEGGSVGSSVGAIVGGSLSLS